MNTGLLSVALFLGLLFQPPRPPVADTLVIAEGRQPQAAVGGDGMIWLTYAQGRTIWARPSNDGGKTFADPVTVAEAPAMDLGMRRGPRIAVTDQGLLVTCIAGQQARGRDGDLLAWRSADGGKSWTEPRMLNAASGSAREGLQATAAAGKHVAVVWLDMREQGTTLFGAFSNDGGKTFSPDRLIYASPQGTVCECCAPQVAVDDGGRIAVMFRNALDGARDMYILKSTDGGKTFSTARKQGEGTWLIAACPMDGGSVILEGDTITAVWRREERLYRSADSFEDGSAEAAAETQLVAGANASLAAGAIGQPYAFIDSEGRVMCGWLGRDEKVELAKTGQDPVAVWSPKAGRALVAWEVGGKVLARLVGGP